MRKIFVAMAFIALSGCVSPSDLKSNTPTIDTVTQKTPKAYALCVLPKWQDARSEATMSETADGYRLIVSASNLADELLEVSRSSSGSKVIFYQRVAWMPGIGRADIESAVTSCL